MFSKTSLVFLVVYFLSDFSHGQREQKFFREDYSYIESLESFYKIHSSRQKWADAKRICALEGASLYYPDNESEAHVVLSFWNTTQLHIQSVYLGISDTMVEGLFETVDGKSISEVYSNWMPGQPNDNGGKQDCVRLFRQGYMNDIICESKHRFICKKSLLSLEWNRRCNISNLEYTYNSNTNMDKCYKLHTTALSWNEAYAVCRLEQSSLAVIKNRLEADKLVDFTESTPKPRVKGNYQRGIYHMGFQNKRNEGWQTVRGTPMNVDAEAWFDNYQPEGGDRDQCGSMFYTGRLINIDCDTKSFFICEHELGIQVIIDNSLDDALEA